jgi:hypothetical protein
LGKICLVISRFLNRGCPYPPYKLLTSRFEGSDIFGDVSWNCLSESMTHSHSLLWESGFSRDYIDAEPLGCFAVAIRQGWQAIGRTAARKCLPLPLLTPTYKLPDMWLTLKQSHRLTSTAPSRILIPRSVGGMVRSSKTTGAACDYRRDVILSNGSNSVQRMVSRLGIRPHSHGQSSAPAQSTADTGSWIILAHEGPPCSWSEYKTASTCDSCLHVISVHKLFTDSHNDQSRFHPPSVGGDGPGANLRLSVELQVELDRCPGDPKVGVGLSQRLRPRPLQRPTSRVWDDSRYGIDLGLDGLRHLY